MAGFALGAHLSAMNVRVTFGALVSHVGKDQLGMALRATHGRMHPAQRIGSLVVIEIRDGANWLPAHAGMARLACDVERSVRAARGGRVLLRLTGNQQRRQQSNNIYKHLFHLLVAPSTNMGVNPEPAKLASGFCTACVQNYMGRS